MGEAIFFCTYKLQKIIPINNDRKNNKIPQPYMKANIKIYFLCFLSREFLITIIS